jgi:hypothetical protein
MCQKEDFNSADWKRPRKPGGGGSEARVYVSELDRYFAEEQLNVIFASVGGKSRFGCTDTTCCRHGEDQIIHPEAHMLTRRARQIDDLSRVSEFRRPEHFLLRHLDPAVRAARKCGQIKLTDAKIAKAIADAKTRRTRLHDALGDLQEKDFMPSQSGSLAFRGGGTGINAVIRR